MKNKLIVDNVLVVLPGPSVNEYRDKIKRFHDLSRDLVVINCNNAPEIIIPDFTLFVNRKRFSQHNANINKNSTLVVSSLIKDSFQNIMSRFKKVEIFYYENDYILDHGEIEVLNNGYVKMRGGTVGPLAICLSINMGAKNVFIAGMDGYSNNLKNSHSYKEEDHKDEAALLGVQKCNQDILDELSGKINIKIITPTVYEKYYDNLLES